MGIRMIEKQIRRQDGKQDGEGQVKLLYKAPTEEVVPKCFKEKQKMQIKTKAKPTTNFKIRTELAVCMCVPECVRLTFPKCVFVDLFCVYSLHSLGRTGECCRPCGRCWRNFERSCGRRRRGDANCSSPTPMTKPPGRSSGQR